MKVIQTRRLKLYIIIPIFCFLILLMIFIVMMCRYGFSKYSVIENNRDNNAECAVKIENISYKKHTVSFDVCVSTDSPDGLIFPELEYNYLKKYEHLEECLPYRVENRKIYICAYYPEISKAVEAESPSDMYVVKLGAEERITRTVKINKKSTLIYDIDRYNGSRPFLFGVNEIIIRIGYLNSSDVSLIIPQEGRSEVSWKQYRNIIANQKIYEWRYTLK